ncbi:MAG: DUF5994 family protein [Nocardioides sp.]
MTTSPTVSQPSTTDPARSPLRLSLQEHPGASPVEGAWWPWTRDLQDESADLVDHFPRSVGYIDRLLFSRPDWDLGDGDVPRKIRAARGPVKVGSFPRDDTHLMVLRLASGRRVRLVVVPASTSEAGARALLARAGTADNQRDAARLLGARP